MQWFADGYPPPQLMQGSDPQRLREAVFPGWRFTPRVVLQAGPLRGGWVLLGKEGAGLRLTPASFIRRRGGLVMEVGARASAPLRALGAASVLRSPRPPPEGPPEFAPPESRAQADRSS